MQTAFSLTSSQSSLGHRLRAERIAQQKTIEDVAVQLRLSTAIVKAMECDDHRQLGAAVFARGRLSNYARLLGVPVDAVQAQFSDALVAPPALVNSVGRWHFERGLMRFSRQGISIALTAGIALLVIWLATRNHSVQPAVALAALDGAPVAVHKATAAVASGMNAKRDDARSETAVVGSIAPPGNYGWTGLSESGPSATAATNSNSRSTPTAASSALQLRFSGDSWVNVVGVDGRVIEHGTIDAGSVRNYRATAIASVEIGNPGAVIVLRNGELLDLRLFQGANATRFTLSSDGKPAPVRD